MMATQLLSDQPTEVIEPHNPDSLEVRKELKEKTTSFSLDRFFDGFFHPANIKWMLVVGAAIVLSSSLMLVNNKWSDWTAAYKFLVMLGYTAAIVGFAGFGDRRLGLKTTGNVLRGLSLLMMPVLLLALSWVGTQTSSTGLPVYLEVAALSLPAIALLTIAGRNILAHFLRGHQLTFLASYVLLAVAGILPQATEPGLAMFYLISFWAILTVGVTKVNRHVFWLAEEHRLPRVFGFFPILLLSAQFLTLCGTKALSAHATQGFVAPPQWFGLITVMLAATVLGTTRTIASVFRARTGDLVRPLPWSIALPLFVGVVLTFAGVCLSFYGFHFIGATTYAVVPTSIVATLLLFMVAYDSRHWTFTAMALVTLTIAYQCFPTLIPEVIKFLKAGAETAVREERLPIAFYGITYLPLLAALTVAAVGLNRIGRRDMASPIQAFIAGVTGLLWCSSLLNVKAILVVAAINCVTFSVYAIVFRDRRFVLGSLLGLVLSAASWVPFANAMYGAGLNADLVALSLILVALLLYGTKFVDSLIHKIPTQSSALDLLFLERDGRAVPVAHHLGLALIVAIGCLRLGWLISTPIDWQEWSNVAIDVTLTGSLALITFRKQHYATALASTILPIASAINYANYLNWSPQEIVEALLMSGASISLAGLLLARRTIRPKSFTMLRTEFGLDLNRFRVSKSAVRSLDRMSRINSAIQCHFVALTDLCTLATVCLGLSVCVPQVLFSNLNVSGVFGISYGAAFTFFWLTACTLVLRNRWTAIALAVIAPPFASAVMISTWPSMLWSTWEPVLWASVAALTCAFLYFYAKKEFALACLVSRIWLVAISTIGLVYLSVPIRIAVVISIGTLLIVRDNMKLRGERFFVAVLTNIHALLFVATLAGAEGWVLQRYAYDQLLYIAAFLLPALTVSALVSDTFLCKISHQGAKWWGGYLRLLSVLLFAMVCMGPIATPFAQILVIFAIVTAVVGEFLAAMRNRREARAWATIAVLSLSIVWAWDQNWLKLGDGWSPILLVTASAISLWLSGCVRFREPLNCFANPLSSVGLVLPAVVAIVSGGSQALTMLPAVGFDVRPSTHSLNYLAILAAAAIYFFQAMTSHKTRYFVLAATILNLGLALLWTRNGFTDPQFYCVPAGLSILWIVELLKKELPRPSHDPLRYVGALIILVSPVYGILGSGWLHLFSLMVLSVLVILLAIGLRIRVLMYTGTAFLMADLSGMLIRSTLDHPANLWVGGIGLGVAVIAFAALCENHRENVLTKIRILSAELASWN